MDSAQLGIFAAALHGLGVIFDPLRFCFLFIGVLMGLALGVIPGLGGLLGLSLLLPFTFTMDPFTAVAIMLGLLAVTSCSDAIPSVLIGVPGTVGAAATIVDGYPMAQRGEAGRALGAAFFSSMCGGLIGALCLAVSVPIMRPLVLAVGTPELLAICVLGLSLVAILSTGAVLKGLAAAAFGILVSTVGMDANTGISRWTFGSLYLWNGVDVVLVALGLFALPELAELFASGAERIASKGDADTSRRAQLQGARDVLRNKFLMVRSAVIGVSLASVPGIGAAVIDWIAYGHAKKTERNAEGFGKGDVRGVIASEGSNSAKDGGALVPTIAFGVPGSPPMALILGALMIQNITPGPSMLSTRLDVTYTLVWSIAVANVMGALLCFAFANQFAKLALVRVGIIIPLILSIVLIGAYDSNQSWGDLYTFALFGVIGWIMKQCGWPRPPMILGFVLGSQIENYLFISIQRFGSSWLMHPIVILFLGLAALGILSTAWRGLTAARARRAAGRAAPLKLHLPQAGSLVTLAGALIFGSALFATVGWPARSQIVPQVICWTGLVCCLMQLTVDLLRPVPAVAAAAGAGGHGHGGGAPVPGYTRRSAIYALWFAGLLAGVALIGMLPAVFVFSVAFMRIQGRERWRLVLPLTIVYVAVMYGLFQDVIHVHWPHSLIGDLWPQLRRATRIL